MDNLRDSRDRKVLGTMAMDNNNEIHHMCRGCSGDFLDPVECENHIRWVHLTNQEPTSTPIQVKIKPEIVTIISSDSESEAPEEAKQSVPKRNEEQKTEDQKNDQNNDSQPKNCAKENDSSPRKRTSQTSNISDSSSNSDPEPCDVRDIPSTSSGRRGEENNKHSRSSRKIAHRHSNETNSQCDGHHKDRTNQTNASSSKRKRRSFSESDSSSSSEPESSDSREMLSTSTGRPEKFFRNKYGKCGKSASTNARNDPNKTSSSYSECKSPRNVKCRYCGKCFDGLMELNSHIHSCEMWQETRLFCEFCEKNYAPSSKSRLSDHMKKMHPKELPFPCEDCAKAFQTKKQLESHISNVHIANCNGETVKCHFCKNEFLTAYKRNEHIKAEHSKFTKFGEFPCKHCNRTCKTHELLRQHMDDVHPDKE